ncbi:MAG: zf-HC2 domain-containing protein [Armatimonadota bacterium]|nr:zf-HC2 domain-containing protein [Armatimonadota bacterium]
MECRKVNELLSALVDGALDQKMAAAIEDHLSHCSDCSREMRIMQNLVQAAGEIEFVEPPQDLAHKIMSAVHMEQVAAERCESVAQLISSYVDDELPVEQAAAVEAHAAVCSRCSNEIRALRKLTETVSALGFVEPPLELRERIAAAAGRSGSAWQTLVSALVSRLLSRPAKISYAAALCGLLAFALVRVPHDSTNSAVMRVPQERPKASAQARVHHLPSAEQVLQSPPVVASARLTPADKSARVAAKTKAVRVLRRHSEVYRTASAAKSRAALKVSEQHSGQATFEHVAPEENSVGGSVETGVASESESLTASTSAAPTPTGESSSPQVSAEAKPGEVRVASAPLIDPQKIEETMREIKAEVGLRRGSDQTVTISVLRSRF